MPQREIQFRQGVSQLVGAPMEAPYDLKNAELVRVGGVEAISAASVPAQSPPAPGQEEFAHWFANQWYSVSAVAKQGRSLYLSDAQGFRRISEDVAGDDSQVAQILSAETQAGQVAMDPLYQGSRHIYYTLIPINERGEAGPWVFVGANPDTNLPNIVLEANEYTRNVEVYKTAAFEEGAEGVGDIAALTPRYMGTYGAQTTGRGGGSVAQFYAMNTPTINEPTDFTYYNSTGLDYLYASTEPVYNLRVFYPGGSPADLNGLAGWEIEFQYLWDSDNLQTTGSSGGLSALTRYEITSVSGSQINIQNTDGTSVSFDGSALFRIASDNLAVGPSPDYVSSGVPFTLYPPPNQDLGSDSFVIVDDVQWAMDIDPDGEQPNLPDGETLYSKRPFNVYSPETRTVSGQGGYMKVEESGLKRPSFRDLLFQSGRLYGASPRWPATAPAITYVEQSASGERVRLQAEIQTRAGTQMGPPIVVDEADILAFAFQGVESSINAYVGDQPEFSIVNIVRPNDVFTVEDPDNDLQALNPSTVASLDGLTETVWNVESMSDGGPNTDVEVTPATAPPFAIQGDLIASRTYPGAVVRNSNVQIDNPSGDLFQFRGGEVVYQGSIYNITDVDFAGSRLDILTIRRPPDAFDLDDPSDTFRSISPSEFYTDDGSNQTSWVAQSIANSNGETTVGVTASTSPPWAITGAAGVSRSVSAVSDGGAGVFVPDDGALPAFVGGFVRHSGSEYTITSVGSGGGSFQVLSINRPDKIAILQDPNNYFLGLGPSTFAIDNGSNTAVYGVTEITNQGAEVEVECTPQTPPIAQSGTAIVSQRHTGTAGGSGRLYIPDTSNKLLNFNGGYVQYNSQTYNILSTSIGGASLSVNGVDRENITFTFDDPDGNFESFNSTSLFVVGGGTNTAYNVESFTGQPGGQYSVEVTPATAPPLAISGNAVQSRTISAEVDQFNPDALAYSDPIGNAGRFEGGVLIYGGSRYNITDISVSAVTGLQVITTDAPSGTFGSPGDSVSAQLLYEWPVQSYQEAVNTIRVDDPEQIAASLVAGDSFTAAGINDPFTLASDATHVGGETSLPVYFIAEGSIFTTVDVGVIGTTLIETDAGNLAFGQEGDSASVDLNQTWAINSFVDSLHEFVVDDPSQEAVLSQGEGFRVVEGGSTTSYTLAGNATHSGGETTLPVLLIATGVPASGVVQVGRPDDILVETSAPSGAFGSSGDSVSISYGQEWSILSFQNQSHEIIVDDPSRDAVLQQGDSVEVDLGSGFTDFVLEQDATHSAGKTTLPVFLVPGSSTSGTVVVGDPDEVVLTTDAPSGALGNNGLSISVIVRRLWPIVEYEDNLHEVVLEDPSAEVPLQHPYSLDLVLPDQTVTTATAAEGEHENGETTLFVPFVPGVETTGTAVLPEIWRLVKRYTPQEGRYLNRGSTLVFDASSISVDDDAPSVGAIPSLPYVSEPDAVFYSHINRPMEMTFQQFLAPEGSFVQGLIPARLAEEESLRPYSFYVATEDAVFVADPSADGVRLDTATGTFGVDMSSLGVPMYAEMPGFAVLVGTDGLLYPLTGRRGISPANTLLSRGEEPWNTIFDIAYHPGEAYLWIATDTGVWCYDIERKGLVRQYDAEYEQLAYNPEERLMLGYDGSAWEVHDGAGAPLSAEVQTQPIVEGGLEMDLLSVEVDYEASGYVITNRSSWATLRHLVDDVEVAAFTAPSSREVYPSRTGRRHQVRVESFDLLRGITYHVANTVDN